MSKLTILKLLQLSILLIFTSNSSAVEKLITKDPHRTEAGFFDIHICNWPDRPPFYLTLFGTEQYDDITSIEVISPDNSKVGELNLSKFSISKKKNKAERHVFLTQLKIPDEQIDGWYSAKINFKNKASQTAQDFIIHQTLDRASSHFPENNAEDIKNPNILSWDAIAGATLYKVFIKDIWAGGEVIHTSKLIKTHSYDIPKGLLQPGGYYAWRVHARDLNEHVQLGDFNAGSLSEWVEFSVAE
jgi:hypothetical protein